MAKSSSRSIARRAVLLCMLFFTFLTFWRFCVSLDSGQHIWSNGHGGGDDLIQDILNATLGFEKIFVLNLPHRTDRRDSITLAASYTNLSLTIREGVNGSSIKNVALPPYANPDWAPGIKGCWRSHMNILREIVEKKITSALILEDDADWDFRIKRQMLWFGVAVRGLTMPLAGADGFPVLVPGGDGGEDGGRVLYADRTFPVPRTLAGPGKDSVEYDGRDSKLEDLEIDIRKLPRTVRPVVSPYGDDWNVLWVGHCGESFATPQWSPFSPSRRIVLPGDKTVPNTADLAQLWGTDELMKKYPNHTRIVHHSGGAVCTTAYAVSFRGARQILWHLGLGALENPVDITLQQFCRSAPRRNCLGVQPTLFAQLRESGIGKKTEEGGAAGGSDTGSARPPDEGKARLKATNENGDMIRDYSTNLRAAVRVSLGALTVGKGILDQYPDPVD